MRRPKGRVAQSPAASVDERGGRVLTDFFLILIYIVGCGIGVRYHILYYLQNYPSLRKTAEEPLVPHVPLKHCNSYANIIVRFELDYWEAQK
jgi:hypothetical protein